MTEESPIACSLNPGDLQRRLDEIAELGTESLIARRTERNRHVLRFRNSAETRERLETIIAAETRCCSFLDLSLEEGNGELLLAIVAPRGAEPVAAQLASAF